MLYHFTPYLTRPNANLRHPLSRAPLALRPASGGLATPPFQSGVRPKKILPWIFLGIAEAKGFCMLLSRASMRLLLFGKKESNIPPWLAISWQETITFPEPAQEKPLRGFFLGLQNRCAILHAANPPSMARYCLARNKYVP